MKLHGLLFSAGLALAGVHGHAISISSTFDTDADGWMQSNGDSASQVLWQATGGNPGGNILYDEAANGGVDRMSAPAKFLGDRSAYVGGTLSFDWQTDNLSSPTNFNDDVELTGNGMTIRYDLSSPTLGEWSTTVIDLTAGAGWLVDTTGIAPTSVEFANLLGDLTQFTILTDFNSGVENPRFDNITLTAVPEPSTVAALLGATALLAVMVRRRRG
ncbi:laminin B domain-containing protein [Cerasicoccus fimbriatus]|uniref:laminin B domain-containing protein n=1 Tax=Cerasicoccus fimbriatus TaxID=3014554 RepID=UPI0022B5645F|nr:laminin B domain-containing protein [Cerasicoccus sp. TK19100]